MNPVIRSFAPRLAALLVCAAIGVLSVPSPAQAERRELRFTGPQITRQLAPSFPLRRCLFGELACVRLTRPVVRMQANDPRIFVSVDVGFQPVPGQASQSGSARVAGQPAYDPQAGAFYLKRPQLLDFSMEGVPPDQGRMVANVISGMLADEFFSEQPLWVLDESDPRQAMARLSLRSVAVQQGALVVTLGDDDEPLEDDQADETPVPGQGSGSTPTPKSLPPSPSTPEDAPETSSEPVWL
ncbi:MAG: DUF1439 domain-containing protein [Lautropia mirabilis]|nr:DUF1439 domain-containing protein [Lautropia mirabilis]